MMFALLFPVICGMLGLVIDLGLMASAHRQSYNAADAAAMAAAFDLMRNRGTSTATATAKTYVQTYNGLASASVTVNSPPTTGPHAGSTKYVEVIVTYPVSTLFAQVLGVNQSQQVTARAVAGYEGVTAGEGVAVLDPNARPGLSVSGGGTLTVNGRVVVNAQGAGYDQNNTWVDLGQQSYAATTSNNSTVKATLIEVVGGVDTPSNFKPYTTGDPSPLHAGAVPESDPLIELPTPVAGMAGVSTTDWKDTAKNINGGNVTLNPGIYNSIKITNNANVTFTSGVYIVRSTSNNAITITGGGTVKDDGGGVMFYNTGSNFDINSGAPDNTDASSTPGSVGGTVGDVTINGSGVNLQGYKNTASPFDGMLFYQRRWNTKDVTIQGNGTSNNLNGTLYAKWANFKVSGSGTYSAQFIAGSIAVSGGGNLTINYSGKYLGKANQVFLVE
jgi:Flp pilus assembly protein TadG